MFYCSLWTGSIVLGERMLFVLVKIRYFFLVHTSCGLRKQIVIIYCFYVLLCQDFLCCLISVFLWYINWLPGCEITWVSVCVFNDAFLFTETFCMSLWSRQGSLWALWLPPYVFVHKLQNSAFSGVCLFTDVDFFLDILGMSGLGMGNQESFVDWSCSIVECLTSLYGVCVLSRTIKKFGRRVCRQVVYKLFLYCSHYIFF